MAMAKLYAELRGRIVSKGFTAETLARRVGVTAQHINNILGCRTQPRLDLCYDILKELDEPPDKLPFYFPPNGVSAEAAQQRTNPRVIRVGARAS